MSFRIASKKEYFCFGCRMFHRFDVRQPVPGLKRAYCEQSHERARKRVGEMKNKHKQR